MKLVSGDQWFVAGEGFMNSGGNSYEEQLLLDMTSHRTGCDLKPGEAATSSQMFQTTKFDFPTPERMYFRSYPSYACLWASWTLPGRPDPRWWEARPTNRGWPLPSDDDQPVIRPFPWPQTMHAVLDPASYAPGETDPREIWGGQNPGAPEVPRCDGADPVNCATGNFYEDFEDLSLPYRGTRLALTRTYNSQAASSGMTGIFGRGWASSYETRIVPAGTGGDVVVVHANGSTIPFGWRDGGFEGPTWAESRLTKLSDGYQYVLPDRTRYRFSTDGRLLYAVTPNGVTHSVTWTSGKATKISAGSRTITLTYGGSAGLVTSANDGTGRTVAFTYQGDRLTEVRDVGGETTRFSYDSDGRMLSRTDPGGATTTNEYESDRVRQQTDPTGKKTSFAYYRSITGWRTKVTDRDGVVTMHRFAHLLPVSVTRGYGTSGAATTRSSFNGRGLVDRMTDPSGAVTRIKYDDRGNAIRIVDAHGRTTTATYNTLDLPTEIRSPAGRVTELAYTSRGYLIRSVQRGGVGEERVLSYTHDLYGQVLSAKNDYSGRSSTYEYDSLGNITRYVAPGGRVTTYGYDARGGLETLTKPSGNVAGATPEQHRISVTRDAYGAPLTVTDELGGITRFSYDARGNQVTVKDADGHLSTSSFDLTDRITSRTRGDGGVDRWTYTGEGRIASTTNGLGASTAYTFDELGRAATERDALGRVSRTMYDEAGNVSGVDGPDGFGPRMEYDKTGRLLKLSHTKGLLPATTYQYDDDGYPTRMADGTDSVLIEWDAQGRVRSRTRGDGTVTRLNWGVSGDLESIDYPDGLDRPSANAAVRRLPFGQVRYSYDAAGDMIGVKDFAGRSFSFTYDANGALSSAAYPQGTVAIGRDRAGRPLSISTPVGSRTYAYTLAGVPKTSAVDGGGAIPLTVDGALHLTAFGTSQAAFDAAEQPISLTELDGTAVTQSFDAAGQQKTRGSGPNATHFSVDSYGRRGRETKTSTGVGQATFAYDGYSRLTSLGARNQTGTFVTSTMSYGVDGTRRSTTRSSVTNWESWEDGVGGDALMLTQGREAYVYGPGGMALERAVEGDAKFLWQDAIGSIIGATNVDGSTAGTYSYDPWGRRITATSRASGALGFAGQVTEPETDYQFLRARYYDPRTAQFISRDPQEAVTRQPYLYAAGNPAMFTDPSGENPLDWLVDAGEAVRDVTGGLAHGVTFGKYKPTWANSCSYWYFGGSIAGSAGVPARALGLTVIRNATNARRTYNVAAEEIRDTAKARIAGGVDGETAARTAVAERSQLKIATRSAGPPLFRVAAEQRNLGRYGNPVGPNYDALLKSKRDNLRIIDGAGRTSKLVNLLFGAR